MKSKSLLAIPKKFENIDFHFLSSNHESTLKGTVLLRNSNMILDLTDPVEGKTYLIIGESYGHYFKGANSSRNAPMKAEAKWSDLNGIYVGLWVEDGYDYYFSFRLPFGKNKRSIKNAAP